MWTISYSRAKFVSRHQGTLPVILTCPHDGKEDPGVPERTGSASGCPPLTKRRDLRTRQITEGVAQLLLDISGEAPYVVIAEFHRKFIDANRSPDCAYEDPKAKQFYDEYHNTIRHFVSEIRAELCSNCHPFYTGKQKLVDAGGRVERFQRRYAQSEGAKARTGASAGAHEAPPADAG